MSRACRATNEKGQPCKNSAVHGRTTCRSHGGTWTPHPTTPVWIGEPDSAMHRALAVPGDTPMDERWVTLRTVRIANSDAYAVVVVDGRNVVVDWRGAALTPSIAKAQAAANRLYDRLTKED